MSSSATKSQWHDMQKLCKKMILFCIPFGVAFMVNYMVDPFAIASQVTVYRAVAKAFDERLWKLNQFKDHPTEYIVIGDSRAGLLSETMMSDITGDAYTNVALSGATLVEIIDTFWFAARHSALKKVFFCINFDRFNDWQTASGVAQAIALINNPLLYYSRPQTLKASWSVIKTYFMSSMQTSATVRQAPPMNYDAFWKYQIDEIDTMYRRTVDSKYVLRQLQALAQYCHEQSIALCFIVLPTHVSLQERIDKAGLRVQEQKFKETIAELGIVYDLDFSNDFTQDTSCFSDPKHCTRAASDDVVRMVCQGTKTNSMMVRNNALA